MCREAELSGSEPQGERREHADPGVVISKRLVIINAASTVFAQLLNLFGLLWMLQYLLARISPEEFAVYPVLMSIMVFAPLFFSFFTIGVSRYIVEAYAKGDLARVPEIVSSIAPIIALISVGFLVAGWTFAYFIADIVTIAPKMVESARVMMALLVLSFSLRMILLPFGVGFHVRQRFVELNFLGVFRDTLRIVLLFVFLTTISASVEWVVVATVISEFAFIVLVTARSMQMTPEVRFRAGAFNRATATSLLSFGLWTTLGQLASVIYTNAGTLLLNAYGSAIDVTNYHLGVTCYRQLWTMVGLAQQPLQPALIAMHAADDSARLGRTAIRGGRYALWASMVVATPLSLFAHDFVALYIGPQFDEAAIVLILLMVIFPFAMPTVLLAMIAMAKAKVSRFNIAALINTLVCVGGMSVALLVWDLGDVGVTAALAGGTIIGQLVFFWGFQLKLANVQPRDFLRETLWTGLLPAVAGGAVWLILREAIDVDSWGELAAAVVPGVLVYFVVLFRFCLDDSDRRGLGGVIRKLRRA